MSLRFWSSDNNLREIYKNYNFKLKPSLTSFVIQIKGVEALIGHELNGLAGMVFIINFFESFLFIFENPFLKHLGLLLLHSLDILDFDLLLLLFLPYEFTLVFIERFQVLSDQ